MGRANNQDYALLCELQSFFTDRIKEVNRGLARAGFENPTISKLMPEYFRKLSQDTQLARRKEMLHRVQIERLGASDSFVRQIGRVLGKETGKKYTPKQIQRIIHLYETLTRGLKEEASISEKPRTKAFYGQLKSQREKTLGVIKTLTGKELDPASIHLGEINLQKLLESQINFTEGKYDEEQFASYTVQRFINLFEDEQEKIERELSKFQSTSGQQRELLYGYIAKTQESANARAVGGVCVGGDNPSRDKENMWDMENFFQLILFEPDTLCCQGLVLLHHFTENGKKILSASLNPSSTYLYSVDEESLFEGIMTVLEKFAKDNSFNLIVFPQTPYIRTNRTGGKFENAIKRRVSNLGKPFNFSSPQRFSYHPPYLIQAMDIAWRE